MQKLDFVPGRTMSVRYLAVVTSNTASAVQGGHSSKTKRTSLCWITLSGINMSCQTAR